MPIYEYVCTDCGLKFEVLRPLTQTNGHTCCPDCGKNAERVFSTFASFSKGDNGMSTPLAGSDHCASCHSGSCGSCGL
ncbi:MAG: zinc ribbon domain-containing protein [Dehalococcoidales bacterium]|nr:zinc ribbon domain-containing protein [Dehalococcoidales bacterium]